MWRRRKKSAVPASLVKQIEEALVRVADSRARLDGIGRTPAPLTERRRAHAELRAAFLDADALLRTATRLAKADSHLHWSGWRHPAVLALGTIRAIDTGMSGPAIGDLLHGRCKPVGAPATYGLDPEANRTAAAA